MFLKSLNFIGGVFIKTKGIIGLRNITEEKKNYSFQNKKLKTFIIQERGWA